MKCHVQTCTMMEYLMLLSLQLHLESRTRSEHTVQVSICNIAFALCWQLTVSTTKITISLPPYRKKGCNNNCTNLFDAVWLDSWCLLLLLLFFSSSWSYHQRDPGAGYVGEPVERGGHQRPHARQLWCLPCCQAEPAGSHPSSPWFSGPIEVQWLLMLPDSAETEEIGETDAALALGDSWVPQRGAGNTRLGTELPLSCAPQLMLNLLVLVLWTSVMESQRCPAFVCSFLSSLRLSKLQCWLQLGLLRSFASRARWQPSACVTAEHDIRRKAPASEIPPWLFIPSSSTKLPRRLRNIFSELMKTSPAAAKGQTTLGWCRSRRKTDKSLWNKPPLAKVH